MIKKECDGSVPVGDFFDFGFQAACSDSVIRLSGVAGSDDLNGSNGSTDQVDPVDLPSGPVGLMVPISGGGAGRTYYIGQVSVITGFNPAVDKLDLGSDSIHNQIPMDTSDGLMFVHMVNPSKTTLVHEVSLADMGPLSFAPIADAPLQQDLSAALAWSVGSGLVRANTVYVRSHEEGLKETLEFNPATDKISMFYLSARGEGQLNFSVEETTDGVRFFSPLTDQSLTLRDTCLSDLNSSHFEWRASQIEDDVAGRMGLSNAVEDFDYQNIFSGKSVAMAGGVDTAPYHNQPDYTGTPRREDPVDPANPSDSVDSRLR